jgi:hypothetical protein
MSALALPWPLPDSGRDSRGKRCRRRCRGIYTGALCAVHERCLPERQARLCGLRV